MNPMGKSTRFNLVYLLFAMFAVFFVAQYWQRAQTVEVVPYSEFEKLLAADKVSEVVVSDQRVTGKLKAAENGKTLVIANLVQPDLAERLSKYNIKYTQANQSTLLRDILSWVVPALVF